MNKKIALNSKEFALMSETHLKILVSQGYEFEINDNRVIDNPRPTTNKVSERNKVSTKVETNKSSLSSKGSKEKASKNKSLKKGDFVKVNKIDSNTKKVVGIVLVGKIKDFDKNGNVVIGDRTFVKTNVVAINKQTYTKLFKKYGVKQEKSKEITKRLQPKEYTIVYAFLASKQDATLADYVELAKATDNEEELKKIRDEISKLLPNFKLSAKEALTEFAKLTEKVEVQA